VTGRTRIAVVEPRCQGLEHAPFNAALVTMAAAMWPHAAIDVIAEAGHLASIRELILGARASTLERIEWRAATIPDRASTGVKRLIATERLFSSLHRQFRAAMPHALFVATADPQSIASLKIRLHTRWRGLPTFAVFHELLGVLKKRRSRKRLSLEAAVLIPHPRTLRYVVLGENILDHLSQMAPSLAARTIAIDHPSLMGDVSYGGKAAAPVPPLRFGFIGGGRNAKGFREFIELAQAIQRDHPTVAFEVIGSVKGVPASDNPNLVWSDEKLPFPEFITRLRGLSHVIWLGTARHYDLVASGSLADAVCLEIPVICQSGPFVDHFFNRFGDIGVRGDTPDDIRQYVRGLAMEFDAGRYRKQKQALERAKSLLTPEVAADVLRSVVRSSD
jgi:hypothetical protein